MIKKIFSLSLVVAALMLTTNVFAAQITDGGTDGTTTTSIGGASFKASKGVVMFATSNGTGFGVASKHTNGDKIYKATSVAPSVVVEDGTIGTDIDADAIPTYN